MKKMMMLLGLVFGIVSSAQAQDPNYFKLYDCQLSWNNPKNTTRAFEGVTVYTSMIKPGTSKLDIMTRQGTKMVLDHSMVDLPSVTLTDRYVITLETNPNDSSESKILSIRTLINRRTKSMRNVGSLQRVVNGKVKYTWAKYSCPNTPYVTNE